MSDPEPSEESTNAQTKTVFNAFASYSTAMDRDLVRDIKRFIETLHENPDVDPSVLEEHLTICVDGTDFQRPKVRRSDDEDVIESLIRQYLRASENLLVFVGPKVREHPYISKEIEWWLEDHPADTVLIALTHGDDPTSNDNFPEIVLRHGLEQQVRFDFRDFRRGSRRRAQRMRHYTEERTRLAAWLIGGEASVNSILPYWREANRRRQRYRRMLGFLATVLVLALAVGAVYLGLEWSVERSRREAIARVTEARSLASPISALVQTLPAARDAPTHALPLLRILVRKLPRHVYTHSTSLPKDFWDRSPAKRPQYVLRFSADNILYIFGNLAPPKSIDLGSRVVQEAAPPPQGTWLSPDHRRGAHETEQGIVIQDFATGDTSTLPNLPESVFALAPANTNDSLLALDNRGKLWRWYTDATKPPESCTLLPPDATSPGSLINLSTLGLVLMDYAQPCPNILSTTCRVLQVKPIDCGPALITRVFPEGDIKTIAIHQGASASQSTIAIGLRTGVRMVPFANDDEQRADQLLMLTEGAPHVTLSPDGALLAVAGFAGEASIYRAANLEHLASIEGHAWNQAIRFSPSGELLAFAGADPSKAVVDVWRLDSAANVGRVLHATKNERLAPAWKPDGSTLAVGGSDGLALLDPETGRQRDLIPSPACAGNTMLPSRTAFTSSSTVITWPTRGPGISWDLESRSAKCIEPPTRGLPRSAISRDGHLLAGLSLFESQVTVWEPSKKRILCVKPQSLSRSTVVTMNQAGTDIAWIDPAQTRVDPEDKLRVHLLSVEDCNERVVTAPIKKKFDSLAALAIDDRSRQIAVALRHGDGGRVVSWEHPTCNREKGTQHPCSKPATARWLKHQDWEFDDSIEEIAFNADGDMIALHTGRRVEVFGMYDSKRRLALDIGAFLLSNAQSLAFDPTGARLAIASPLEPPWIIPIGNELLRDACDRVPPQQRTQAGCLATER